MVYYKCTEKCTDDLGKIITINILDFIFRRSVDEKIGNMCHYICLKQLSLENIKRNGRWGFCPVLGMTEFFSVVFSFSNFIINQCSFNLFLRPQIQFIKMKDLFKLQCHISNMAFISSTLFHIHENVLTRNMDYYFAILVLLFGLYMSFMRLMLIYKFECKYRFTIRSIFICYFIYHISRMSNEFDYVYNKISCVIIITLTFLFHFFIYAHYKSYEYVKNIVFFTFLFSLAGYIEIQDIPPYKYLLDSHAVWHLFGCLSTPFYIKFWADDIKHHRHIYNNLNVRKRKCK